MAERIYQLPFAVDAGSIDVLGHVNNWEYLRWMEAAATAHAAQCGWSFDALRDAGRMWVARQHWVEYLRPAFEGDRLNLCTWVQSFRGSASLRRYALKRGGELLMIGATEWIFVDYARRRPVRIGADVAATFPIVAADDAELRSLGIDRPIRYAPSAWLLA